MFAGDPPRLVAIERVYGTGLTIHTVSLGEGLTRVVIEKIRHADVEVLEPTSEVRFVGQTLGTFIAWSTYLLKVISKKHKVYCHHFSSCYLNLHLMLFKLIHLVLGFWLQDGGKKQKSPSLEPQPPQQLQTNVNPIQELFRLSHIMYDSPYKIWWDHTVFGVDNGGMPLYIYMHDIMGTQMLNIVVI